MRRHLPVQRLNIASFDGTPLGVQVIDGDDDDSAARPVLLLANGLGATVGAYRFIVERFPRAFRYVSWDYRGLHGSARPVRGYASLSVEDHARDALAVLDALAVRDVHVLAWSMGVQVVLELFRHAGERFETLVLHNGVPGRTWETLGFPGVVRRAMDPILKATQRADGLVERTLARAVEWPRFLDVAVRAGIVHHDVDRSAFLEIARGFKELDMHLYLETMRQLAKHDASDVLPRISCPALVVQATEDKLTPLSVAQRMARDIPGARLALLPGGTHWAAAEMPALINEHLAEFWRVAGIDVDVEKERAQ